MLIGIVIIRIEWLNLLMCFSFFRVKFVCFCVVFVVSWLIYIWIGLRIGFLMNVEI